MFARLKVGIDKLLKLITTLLISSKSDQIYKTKHSENYFENFNVVQITTEKALL